MSMPFSKSSGQKVKYEYDQYLQSADSEKQVDEKVEIPANDEIPMEMRCGYGPCCKPACIQGWNRPGVLLACVCFYTFTQGFIVNGAINVNMSTIERRFELSSFQVAWISSSYDIVAGLTALTVGYLGTFVHNGRILAVCSMCMATGSFIMFIPYITAGIYQMGQATSELCIADGDPEDCSDADPNLSNNLYIFILGQMFHGVGGAAVYTLAIPYMDSNIHIKNTPMYIGIMTCFSALGPACGFIVGGYCLTLYVDFPRVPEDDITVEPGDPRWVGAWWICYLVSACLGIILSVLMWLWPRELPTAAVYRSQRYSVAYKGKGEKETEHENFGKSWKDLKYSLKNIFTNPIWIISTVAGIVQSGTVIAFAVFLPKIMQYQFAMTPGMAAIAAGAVSIPGACGGYLLGGIIPRCLNIKMKGFMVQCLTSSCICVVTAFIYLIHCESQSMAGVTVPYPDDPHWSGEVEVERACNENCTCSTASYDPVCGVDGIQYFSTCHAGCTDEGLDEDDKAIYYNCSCINATVEYGEPMAYENICTGDCVTELVLFLILFLIQMLATFAGSTAGQAMTIRAIPDKERAFAAGVQSIFVRYLGNVPGPIIFGMIFDIGCLVWQEKCDETGSCWFYDSNFLAWGLSWTVFVVAFICGTCYVLAIILYKPPPEDEEELIVDSKLEKEQNGSVSHSSEEKPSTEFSNNPATFQGNEPRNVAWALDIPNGEPPKHVGSLDVPNGSVSHMVDKPFPSDSQNLNDNLVFDFMAGNTLETDADGVFSIRL